MNKVAELMSLYLHLSSSISALAQSCNGDDVVKIVSEAGVEAARPDLFIAFNDIKVLCEHNIPSYAYGDNEAACDMASRFEKILEIIARLKEISVPSATEK